MLPTTRDAYLETQILTATPQRLRLMLIEGAIRKITAAKTAYEAADWQKASADLGCCRDIITELIAGIDPEQTPIAKQILSVYMFLYSTLVEAQFGRDANRLSELIRVLEVERQTWRELCEKMPDRATRVANPAHDTEELAPQRVAESWSGDYAPVSNMHRHRESAFTLDA
jgi:flagellar secretion chaperone FliS